MNLVPQRRNLRRILFDALFNFGTVALGLSLLVAAGLQLASVPNGSLPGAGALAEETAATRAPARVLHEPTAAARQAPAGSSTLRASMAAPLPNRNAAVSPRQRFSARRAAVSAGGVHARVLRALPAAVAAVHGVSAPAAAVRGAPARVAAAHKTPARVAAVRGAPARVAAAHKAPVRIAAVQKFPARAAVVHSAPARLASVLKVTPVVRAHPTGPRLFATANGSMAVATKAWRRRRAAAVIEAPLGYETQAAIVLLPDAGPEALAAAPLFPSIRDGRRH